jgi:cytochrome P450
MFQLKSLYPLVLHVTKKLNEHITDEQSPLDVRDLCQRYTCDAIANCLFGIDALSLSLENAELFKHSKKMMKGIMDAVLSFYPRRLFPVESAKFFEKLVKDAIKYRLENSVDREDFLSQLISSHVKKNLPEPELMAQAWSYYMDSFDTAGIGLHYMLYELAKNKRVQEKLREEIEANIDGDVMEFEKLLELEYLDQVFHEALRLHPPLLFTTRVCSENYELDGAKGHKFTMNKNDVALICIYSIHRDPGLCGLIFLFLCT